MPQMFDKILAALSGVKSIIGVDIGSSAVKIVQLRRDGERAVLENYGELALGPYAGLAVGQATNLSPEKISAAIRDLIAEAKFSVQNGAIAIPISASLLSFIEIPTEDERKLEKVIPIEARKYIPMPINEVALDWWVLPKRGEITKQKMKDRVQKENKGKTPARETSEVVISAIHNETISKYRHIQKETDLNINLFEIEIFSSIRSVIGRDMSPLMILDIGAATTKLALVEYGIVKSYHIINKGSQDITVAISSSMETKIEEAEKLKRKQGLRGSINGKNISDIASASLGYIFSEAGNAVANFEQKYGVTVKKIILTGGGALLKGLPELAQNYFKSEVVLGYPFEKVEYPAFLEGVLRQTGPEFAVSVGIALKALQGNE